MERRQFFGLGRPSESSSIDIGHGPVIFPTSAFDPFDLPAASTATDDDDGIMPTSTSASIARFPTLTSSSAFGFGFPIPVASTSTRATGLRRTTASSALPRTSLSSTLATSTADSTSLAAGAAQSDAAASAIPAPVTPAPGSGSQGWIAAAVIVPLAVLVLLALAVLFWVRRRKQRQQQQQQSQHGTRSSTATAGIFHTGRSSAMSDMEKFGDKSAGGAVLAKPTATVTHNYLSSVDLSGQSSIAWDTPRSADQSVRPMASFAATNSRATSSGGGAGAGVTPMTIRSNPFTDGSHASSRPAFSFSGLPGGGDAPAQYGPSAAINDTTQPHLNPPPAGHEPVSPISPRHDAIDDDAISIISEAEVHQGEVAHVGRKQRASVVMMGGNSSPSRSGNSSERRPS